MKTFNVYKHYALGYQAVKIGFSWPGFLFSVIWLFIKKLWVHAFILICGIILLTSIEIYFNNVETSVMVIIIEFGIYIIVGLNGNKWYMNNLKEHGFELLATVKASNPASAIQQVVNT